MENGRAHVSRCGHLGAPPTLRLTLPVPRGAWRLSVLVHHVRADAPGPDARPSEAILVRAPGGAAPGMHEDSTGHMHFGGNSTGGTLELLIRAVDVALTVTSVECDGAPLLGGKDPALPVVPASGRHLC